MGVYRRFLGVVGDHGGDTVNGFQQAKALGNKGESLLDRMFSVFFDVKPATPEQQMHGIDRVMVGKQAKQKITVEYKTDYTAATSGNAFIELESGDKSGWALTCEADFIAYIVPGKHVYVFRPCTLRNHLSQWKEECIVKSAQNPSYHATGLLVPLSTLAGICETFIAV
jgi:hypothetical protein